MIVDVHTHTSRWREQPPEDPATFNTQWRPDGNVRQTVTWDEFVAALEPVDRAIAFNIADDPRPGLSNENDLLQYPIPDVNDDTAALVNAYPDKLIGFLSVHPHHPHAFDEIDRAVGDLGLRGIKLGPNYQNFDPIGDEAMRLFRRAQELRLPVLLHQGTSPDQFADLDYAHPRHLDRVAMAFPDLKMILAHMGHPWQVDCIAVIRKHPNLYADVSALFYRPWSFYNAMRLATEWSVLDKLLFGSDYPVATPEETMDGLRNVNSVIKGTQLPPVPEVEIDRIIHRDSLGLLELG